MIDKPKVSLIVITYNNEGIIKKSLESFLHFLNDYIDEVIVFDNASNDKSLDEIDEINDRRIKVIKSVENLGYRKALNKAMKMVNNAIVIVTNPDIYLIDNSLINIIKIINNDNKIAIGCPIPTTQNYFMYKEILPCILFKRLKSNELVKDAKIIESYMGGGSIFVIRKDVYDKIGGLDETCFMYGEEIELSYKARKLGYRIIWDTSAKVIHESSYSIKRVKDSALMNKISESFYCGFFSCYQDRYKDKNIFYKLLFFLFYYLLAIGQSIRYRNVCILKIAIMVTQKYRTK
jgi:GT2 family glycosyltransferase